MTVELESKFLLWINEELATLQEAKSTRQVPIQLLMMRLALENRQERGDNCTHSTEISLQTFERASLFRILRQLERKGVVTFKNSEGALVESSGLKDEELTHIDLTTKGQLEVGRIARLQVKT